MASSSFVHLRLHSEYSISDGVTRIKSACAKAAEDGMPALALTDLSNLFGMVKFYEAACGKGIKPVIGCDVWIGQERRDAPTRLLLLVQNRDGYLRLCRWITRAFLENQHRGRAELLPEWFEADGTDGLIALSGAQMGDVGQAFIAGNPEAATTHAKRWAELFSGRFYLEIQRAGHPNAENLVRQTVSLASSLRLPVVATHPIEFLTREEFLAHEARVCISEGYVLSDQRRPRPYTEEQYFKTQAEMAELFADLPQALENAVEIAKRCSLMLELGKPQLPQFPTPGDMPLEQYLTQQSEAGLQERMLQLYPDAAERERELPRYRERLAFEIETIVAMGFPGYFLIVADFINWAKHNGVPVGPGRGSGAGSLVAYSLGITDLDPLRYNLLFERFLNPERVSMPDFDIDFCQDGRDRVIDYVRQKYGSESVSQIATFGTMAAKAVVRDVGRVMEWTYGRTDELAKLIPFQPGKLITLEMAREMEPRLKEREESEEETRELLALAEQLEGLTRNVGMHAGGVLIAPGKLSDFCPLYSASGSDSVISQLDKDDVEKIGLVKFDFLGLTTLTILDWTLRFIRRLNPDSKIDLESLPLDNADAYKMFVTGNTTAIFQFESRGMRDLVQRAKPDRFEDIIALVALFRPGPMDLIPDFVERKHGRQRVTYPDSRVEPILSETYGIMVYQEQVMQMAQIIGGYSLGGADLLRRAMGKKKPEEMAKHRTIFLEGAVKNGLKAHAGNEIFDLMEKFAGYGFNKSHAAAYALVAYHTAYFKAHHPAPFMAANFSAVMDDTDKVQQLHNDCIANGLEVLPPDVHESEYRFVPVDDKRIRYGLGAIKGTGQSAIEHIMQVRGDGPFADLFDFCRRVDRRLVNRRVIESLVRAGAFDCIDNHRARLFKSVGVAMTAADQESRAAAQVSLFSDEAAPVGDVVMVDAPRWDERTRLQEEKQALGFYYSGHPYHYYEKEFSSFVSTKLDKLQQPSPGETRQVLLAGVIESMRMQKTGTGRMMVMVLSDGSASQEVVVYDEVFDRYRNLLRDDAVVLIEAKQRSFRRGGDGGDDSVVTRLSADCVYDLAGARERFGRTLRLSMNGAADAKKLRQLLEPYRNGSLRVCVTYTSAKAQADFDLGEDWKVKPDDTLMTDLGNWLEPENVRVIYQ